jgi:hypothetical protein
MQAFATIGKLGFRRWYERQLIEAHAWLVTCLACAFAVAVCVEAYIGRGPLLRQLSLALIMFAAGGISIYGWQRYREIMVSATRLAERAVCTVCASYGLFNLVAADADTITVRCRKCAHEWRMG